MQRWTIKCYGGEEYKDPQGEWVKYEEAKARYNKLLETCESITNLMVSMTAKKNDLEDQVQALKSWRNDWHNIKETNVFLVRCYHDEDAGFTYRMSHTIDEDMLVHVSSDKKYSFLLLE